MTGVGCCWLGWSAPSVRQQRGDWPCQHKVIWPVLVLASHGHHWSLIVTLEYSSQLEYKLFHSNIFPLIGIQWMCEDILKISWEYNVLQPGTRQYLARHYMFYISKWSTGTQQTPDFNWSNQNLMFPTYSIDIDQINDQWLTEQKW